MATTSEDPGEQVKTQVLAIGVPQAAFWLGVHHRMLCSDAKTLSELYERIAWLSRPWWRRAFRKPPWLR